jgi:hypothetical protein
VSQRDGRGDPSGPRREAITLVSVDHVPDAVYDVARQHFSESELVALTAAVVAISGWNRLAIAFRTVPESFELGRPGAGDQEASSTAVRPKNE